MLADLVNGGGCLAEGSDSNNPLAKLSKSVVEGPASMGKQPMHHGQHDPLMGLQGGPSSSMNGTLPSMGPEEHAFMQAFHAAPPEEVAAELSRAWAASQMMPSGEASSSQDGAWLEAAAAQNAAWREAHASQQVAAAHEAALEPVQQQAGQAVHGALRSLMGNPAMPAVPAEAREPARRPDRPPPNAPSPPSHRPSSRPRAPARRCCRVRGCRRRSRRRRGGGQT